VIGVDVIRRFESSGVRGLRRFAEVQRALYPGTFPAILDVGGGVALFAGIGSPLTFVGGLGLTAPVSDDDVAQIEAFYAARGVPTRIDVTPLVDETFAERLTRSGYVLRERLSAWWRPLERADDLTAKRSAITVTEATRPEERELWAMVIAAGFEGVESGTETSGESVALGRIFASMGNVRCFLASIAGTPVGGSGLAVDGDLATLFGMSTLPPWRGYGVHQALICARLIFAANAGCTTARAEATIDSVSERNITRAGFTRAYEKRSLSKPLVR